MKKMVLASNNVHKVKEVKQILKNYDIITLKDIGYYEEIEENGETFEENALIKARTIHNYLKEKELSYSIIAEDSGLCVESLNGAPGVYSARYSGEHGNDKENRNKLLKELEGKENRDAFFICTIVLYKPNGEYETFTGKTYGKITCEELGCKDFGYDCIFYSKDLKMTFGEANSEEKDSISHRGRALKKLLNAIKD